MVATAALSAFLVWKEQDHILCFKIHGHLVTVLIVTQLHCEHYGSQIGITVAY